MLLRIAWVPGEMFVGTHDQQRWESYVRSLDAMRALSGLPNGEAMCVLSCLPRGWRPPEDKAHRLLRGLVSAFGRGRHMPEYN